MPLLSVENLTYTYGRGTPFEKTAVSDVSFSVEPGEIVGLIGHTGSGKSTLVQHLNGLLRPQRGRVLLDGKDIWQNEKRIRDVRFRVGLVFQYPEYQLFEDTVEQDIAFGPKNCGLPPDEVRARVAAAAEAVGLPEKLLKKSPFDLSGGEKRRAAIAGIMAMQPACLVLDEPTAGLDPAGRDQVLSLLTRYRDTTGAAVLIVSHSMEDMAKLAEKLLVMHNGSLALSGTTAEVFAQADALVEMGLDVPQITAVFLELRRAGLPLPTVYTVDAAVDALLAYRAKGGDPA